MKKEKLNTTNTVRTYLRQLKGPEPCPVFSIFWQSILCNSIDWEFLEKLPPR